MSTTTENTDPLHPLSPLVPEGRNPTACLPPLTIKEFSRRWAQLTELGFEVEIRPSALRVRHSDRGFDTVIHLSTDNDLGELRVVFQKIKDRFGTRRDRWFGGMFQASAAVTEPYCALKTVVETCQKVRQSVRRAEAA